MLVVQVELLTGRYVATRFNDRTKVEWPPHPARLFSAAVAAWAEQDAPDPHELIALEWWEAQGAPSVRCSWTPSGPPVAQERAPVVHYVPDNDVQVVARDLSTTYRTLRAAEDGVGAVDRADAKATAKAERVLAAARTKVIEDSGTTASRGQAPGLALRILPQERGRQARSYPTIVPEDDVVTYAWPDADGNAQEVSVLDRVLARIARLGHSSSLVAVSVVDETGPPTLRPDEGGDTPLRVASPGQLDALTRAYEVHGGCEPRVLPALIETYRFVGADLAGPVEPPRPHLGDDWVLLGISGGRFMVRDSLALTRTVRSALLHHSEVQPPPQVLSGHVVGAPGERTRPAEAPHLAVLALPFVGHRHADELVKALALVLPRTATADDRAAVMCSVARWIDDGGELRLGRRGMVTVEVQDEADLPRSARPDRWCRPSRHWSSVTPVALDRFPGHLNDRVIERRRAAETAAVETVAASCEHIGLPRPTSIRLGMAALLRGTSPVRRFPPYAVQQGRLRRALVHVELGFEEPVSGPVLIGAGRYLGYGLCLPMHEADHV